MSATLSHDTVPYPMRNLRSTPEGKKILDFGNEVMVLSLGKAEQSDEASEAV